MGLNHTGGTQDATIEQLKGSVSRNDGTDSEGDGNEPDEPNAKRTSTEDEGKNDEDNDTGLIHLQGGGVYSLVALLIGHCCVPWQR